MRTSSRRKPGATIIALLIAGVASAPPIAAGGAPKREPAPLEARDVRNIPGSGVPGSELALADLRRGRGSPAAGAPGRELSPAGSGYGRDMPAREASGRELSLAEAGRGRDLPWSRSPDASFSAGGAARFFGTRAFGTELRAALDGELAVELLRTLESRDRERFLDEPEPPDGRSRFEEEAMRRFLGPVSVDRGRSRDAPRVFTQSMPFSQRFERRGESRPSTRTRVSTNGRIQGSGGDRWSIEWRSELAWVDGGAPWEEGERDAAFDLHGITVSRRFEGRGLVRMGHKLSPGIGGVGQLDGVQGEVAVGELFRFGLVAGFRPDRRERAPSIDEPLGLAYFGAELGDRRALHYRGTLGVLGTMFRGKPDRFAYLVEQRVALGSRLRLSLDSELDIDVEAADPLDVLRFTRTSFQTETPISSSLTLRAGLDHRRRPDTLAERDQLSPESYRLFEEASRRYWLGGSYRLPWSFRVDGELSYAGDPGEENFSERWRVSLSRAGLPSFPDVRLQARVYNLHGSGPGYGGALSADVPLLERKLSLRPSMGFRFLEPARETPEFRVTDCAVHANWRTGGTHSVHLGFYYSFADSSSERTMIDLAVQWRW